MSRETYHRIAGFYDLLELPFEYGRYRPLRRELFRGLRGTVLDAGVGTGRNVPFYPPGAFVVAIDLSPTMLARARRALAPLASRAALLEMNVLETAFADRAFDAVAASFLFCVLDYDQQLSGLVELARVCKPGGEIRLLDYTYSDNPLRRLLMRLTAPLVRSLYGAAFDRNTERYLSAAGLELVERRYLYRDIIRMLVVRPAAGGT